MIKFSFLGTEYKAQRVIGDLNQSEDQSRPVVVFTGAIHGNEPSGVIALIHVFGELIKKKIKLQGRVIGLAGNLQALPTNARFIAKDLNRIWDRDFTQRYHSRESNDASVDSSNATCNGQVSEYDEQTELFEIIEPLIHAGPPVFFIDLHTTSSRSVPFIAINDQIANRNFALQFPVPTVLGIEEYLSGPLLSYLNDYGPVALAFEAGQHDDPESVRIHTSFIYLSMFAAGAIAESDIPNLEEHRARLEMAGSVHHGIFEVIFRKPISQEDQFSMNVGYQNFDSVRNGESLARDRQGVIAARSSGRIFMPLYQNSGNDGFFLVRRVPMWALKLSAVLRRVNFERVLTWLPGVSHDPNYPDALVVNKRVARFLARELFHLLGYRRKKEAGSQMIFSRREIGSR